MVEIIIWAASMLLVGIAALRLSNKIHSAQVDRLTISEKNASLLSRTFKSTAISYFLVTPIVAVLALQLPEIHIILKEWWILEVFIFWNLRTAWLYHRGFQCLSY